MRLFKALSFGGELLCDVVWFVFVFCAGFRDVCELYVIYCVVLYGLGFDCIVYSCWCSCVYCMCSCVFCLRCIA